MPGQQFVERFVTRDTLVPANTAEASAVSDTWSLGRVVVVELTVVVPSGHAGLTGYAVQYDGERIVPFGGSTDWIVADGVEIPIPVDVEIGHALVIRAFNTDIYSHRFYTRARVVTAGAIAPVPFGAGAALVL